MQHRAIITLALLLTLASTGVAQAFTVFEEWVPADGGGVGVRRVGDGPISLILAIDGGDEVRVNLDEDTAGEVRYYLDQAIEQ